MPRIARVVVPGQPHHVTQRGVRSMRVFSGDPDRQAYLDLVREHFDAHDVEVRAWCLMTNHIHLIAVPESCEGLAGAIGQVHQRYTRMINFRQKKRGYLFQGRFHVGLRKSDALVRRRDLLGMESKWRACLRGEQEHAELLRKRTRTGRPCGQNAYVKKIEARTGRDLTPKKPGPRPKNAQR